MSPIRAVFFDVGGVLLTNGWDRHARQRAIERFDLDPDDFADRHEQVIAAFESGRLTEEQYLDRTVFHTERPFTREQFRAFMYDQSRLLEDGALDIVDALHARGDVLLATLNNESAALNAWRIRTFGLHDRFRVFLSSCYVGLRKPDAAIFELALDLTQVSADQALFIDDRALNAQCAHLTGLRAHRYRGSAELREWLAVEGVAV